MKKLIFITSFILFVNLLLAQSNKSSVGLRLGTPIAASYKTYLSEDTALEAILGFGNYSRYVNYTNFRIAYLKNKDIPSIDLTGLSWYYGGGAGVFLWSYDDLFFRESTSTFAFGLSGYIGLEYNINNLPLSISLDWAPTIILSGFGSGLGAGYGSIAVRYSL